MCSFVSLDDRPVHLSTWLYITGQAFMKLSLVNSSSRVICSKIAVSYAIPSMREDVISAVYYSANISLYSFGFRMDILVLRQNAQEFPLIFPLRVETAKEHFYCAKSLNFFFRRTQNTRFRNDQAYQWLTSCFYQDGKISVYVYM